MKRKAAGHREKKSSSTPAAGMEKAAPPKNSFPIVGIGASAGGLEALEQFLGRVPANSGMAFVIVQHLDPTRKGMMPELLQRASKMKVVQVKDCTRVQPDVVYVIPPNKDMSILHGILHLLDPAAPRGLRLPIDFFLRSLAEDQQERSIAVILSGMGSDGTLGLRAVKEQAGVVLVQDPASARFDGMPRSAIDAGLADIVAPVTDLPGKLIQYLERTPLLGRGEVLSEDQAHSDLEKAVILLRAHTGHDFSLYKRNTLHRRVERRMAIHQLHKMPLYIRFLRENPQELDLLFKELLIGVTNFFRDPAAWDQLRKEVLPTLLAKRASGHALRAWVPACSTGEEAYTLAIVFREAIEEILPKGGITLQIFATDLDRDAIDKARHGSYPANIAADLSPAQLKRYFTEDDHGYRVRKEIREMVIFAPQNLIMDPPFTKLDILSCRNVLIYLKSEVQQKLIPLFHYSLAPGGILFLGSAETVGAGSGQFAPVSAKARIYQRVDAIHRAERIEFPSSFSSPPIDSTELRPVEKSHSLQTAADQFILHHHAPPAVIANDKGDIFYISGRTGKYLEPAAGKANWNLFAMAREGLRYELADAFHKAVRLKQSVSIHNLKVEIHGGGAVFVDVVVQRLEEPGSLQGLVLILFTEVRPPVVEEAARPSKRRAGKGPSSRVEEELQRVRGEARITREEMQTAQEELRSANEELQSTNEELQSTNEELTTSKEEMQSLNEELQTVNSELQTKVYALTRTSNDMKNLLDSTDIATLFLDRALNVRRFTPQTVRIIKLIPSDIGRPITDLVSELNYPDLAANVRQVLRTLAPIEKVVTTSSGRWFNVRIMPYRTIDDRIEGVVITFSDISTAKALEAKLRATQATLELRITDQSVELSRPREGHDN